MSKRRNHRDVIWLYGRHAVRAALNNPEREILRVVALEPSLLCDCKTKVKIEVEIVDKNFFTTTFGKDAIHQGCAVQVRQLADLCIEDIIEDDQDNRPLVFLDQVTDPQNIGSILRASAVFGARAVVVADDNSPEITASIAKTASGAVELVPIIRVTNLVQTIKKLKKAGFWCVGLDERGNKQIHELSLSGKYIFVIGSEGNGMRRLTREECDFLAIIPNSGEFSTLNAAQAATVTLYEFLRQQKQ